MDACAVVFSFRDAYSLSSIARRIVHEDVNRLLAEGRTVVVIDPGKVLEWDLTTNPKYPYVFADESAALDYIGGKGCSAVTQDDPL
jgi:hypothetical protein